MRSIEKVIVIQWRYNVLARVKIYQENDVNYPLEIFASLSRILCKPPKWCKIGTSLGRYFYEQKNTHSRRADPSGKDSGTPAGKQRHQHGRHPEPVQRNYC